MSTDFIIRADKHQHYRIADRFARTRRKASSKCGGRACSPLQAQRQTAESIAFS
jgi:hypothetical protein